MKKGKSTIYCTANCKYNSGRGCYNVCEHPKHEGIMTITDNVYTNICSYKEERNKEIRNECIRCNLPGSIYSTVCMVNE